MSVAILVAIEASAEGVALQRTRRSVEIALGLPEVAGAHGRVVVVESLSAEGPALLRQVRPKIVVPLRAGDMVGAGWLAGALAIAGDGASVARPELHLRYGGAQRTLIQTSLIDDGDRARALAAAAPLLAAPLAARPTVFERFGWPPLGFTPSDEMDAWRWTQAVFGTGLPQKIVPGSLYAVRTPTTAEPLAEGEPGPDGLVSELVAGRADLRYRLDARIVAGHPHGGGAKLSRRLVRWLRG